MIAILRKIITITAIKVKTKEKNIKSREWTVGSISRYKIVYLDARTSPYKLTSVIIKILLKKMHC